MFKLFLFPPPSSSRAIFFRNRVPHQTLSLTRAFLQSKASPTTTMSINLQFQAFAGNPLRSKFPMPGDPIIYSAAFEALNARIRDNSGSSPSSLNFKVLPFRNGMPLSYSTAGSGDSSPIWHLGLIDLNDLKGIFENSGAQLCGDSLVYLGSTVLVQRTTPFTGQSKHGNGKATGNLVSLA